MGFIRFLIWTGFCVGLGIFLATYDVRGQTPLSLIQQFWKDSEGPARLKQLEQGARAAVPRDPTPTERHSPEDRERVGRLIAGRR